MKPIMSRMKDNYEDRYRIKLTRRTPVVIRLDGKAFHSLTKKCLKPFDFSFHRSMMSATLDLVEEIQGAKCAYVYSDEVSVLVTDYDRLETDAWFDYNLQKMVSVSAAIMSIAFTARWREPGNWEVKGCFDSRAFNLPESEVNNYFVARQQDCIRNSIQALAQSEFPHKELQGLNQIQLLDKLRREKDIIWEARLPRKNYGTFIDKDCYGKWTSSPAPIFKVDKNAVERYVYLQD